MSSVMLNVLLGTNHIPYKAINTTIKETVKTKSEKLNETFWKIYFITFKLCKEAQDCLNFRKFSLS